jgi:hypothetical protein
LANQLGNGKKWLKVMVDSFYPMGIEFSMKDNEAALKEEKSAFSIKVSLMRQSVYGIFDSNKLSTVKLQVHRHTF